MNSWPMPILALVPTGLLRWFDDAPWAYWGVAWTAWIVLLGVVALRLAVDWATPNGSTRVPARLVSSSTFVAIAVLAVLAFRWPMVFAGPMMNPDEAQHGAAAITYWQDPVPWRSVDLHTSGPLNAYVLWPAMLLGGGLDYTGLRLTALGLHLVTALALYGLLRRVSPEGVARLASLPLFGFFAFTASWEFVQYSSEQLSLALLAVASWLLSLALHDSGPKPDRMRLVIAGVLLGCLPFAKMQAVPLGLMVGVIGLFAMLVREPGPPRQRLVRAASLVGGALAPAVIMALVLEIYGLWAQARISYLDANAGYLDGYNDARITLLRSFVPSFVRYSEAFVPYFWGTVGLASFAIAVVGLTRLQPRGLLAAAWLSVAVGVVTVVFPGRAFFHYLHFLLLPLGCLAGFSLAALFRQIGVSVPAPRQAAFRWGLVAVVAAGVLLPQVVNRVHEVHPAIGKLVQDRIDSVHPVSARLRALAQPGDTLMAWGWAPRLYLESGLPQGTRESHNYKEVENIQLQAFFRERTLRDLRKNQPALFVDAVAPDSFSYVDRKVVGLQVFPELAEYVASHYRLEEELAGYRIYVRLDRAATR